MFLTLNVCAIAKAYPFNTLNPCSKHFLNKEIKMEKKILITAIIILALLFSTVILAQEVDKKIERKLKKMEQKLKDKEHQLHSIEIPEMHLDLNGLEESMVHLQHSLSHLEHIEIPDIHVDIPEIDIDIPKIPDIHVDIPPIHIPHIEMDHFDFDFALDFYEGTFIHFDQWDHSDLFENLSEDEEIKLSAIRSMGKQESEKAIPALKKVLNKGSTPAFRYEAVRQLRKFLDEDGVLETLAKVAQSDKNVEVRKKAIYVLGRCKDPKAVEILKEIAER